MDQNKETFDRLKQSFPKPAQTLEKTIDQQWQSEQFYALFPREEQGKRFKLILRSGHSHSIPYAVLPIISLLENEELRISAYELLVVIKGRNLAPLEKHLSDERIRWMRESAAGHDDGSSEIFISTIQLSGDSINV